MDSIKKLFDTANRNGCQLEAYDIMSWERKLGYQFKVTTPSGKEYPARSNEEGIEIIMRRR